MLLGPSWGAKPSKFKAWKLFKQKISFCWWGETFWIFFHRRFPGKYDTILQDSKQEELQHSKEINIHLNLRCAFVYCLLYMFFPGLKVVCLACWYMSAYLSVRLRAHQWTFGLKYFSFTTEPTWPDVFMAACKASVCHWLFHKRTKTSCWTKISAVVT